MEVEGGIFFNTFCKLILNLILFFLVKCTGDLLTFVGMSSRSINFETVFLDPSLPETSNLPSVFMFAECILSDTRQTRSLPIAALKTFGKKHSANLIFDECFLYTRQTSSLPSVLFLPSVFSAALDKEFVRRVPKLIHSTNIKTLGKFDVSGSEG